MATKRPMLLRSLVPCALLAFPLIAPGAGAQPPASDQCAGLPSQAEEIACLRNALQEKTDALVHARSGKPTTQKQERAEPRQAKASGRSPGGGPAVPASKAAQEPARPAIARAADEMGKEQLPGTRNKDREDLNRSDALQAVVLSVKEDREGLFNLTLDNGQVWKQVERPGTQIILHNKTRYSVEIAKSGFGGYRMYFPEIRRYIVVKRVI
jgi:hypothetical protein